MIFKRINENTVNCHISKEDLQESGIRIDDLLMQKKETLQNLRDAVQRAAVQENFTLDGHFNTMQLAVLRDSSISLTLSQERAIPDSLFSNAGKELLDAARANWTGENRESEEETGGAESAQTGGGLPDTVYFFRDMEEAIRTASLIRDEDAEKVSSSLYRDKKSGRYFLLLQQKEGAGEEGFAHITLVLNEFAKKATSSSQEIAFRKEHAECIRKDHALADLKKL